MLPPPIDACLNVNLYERTLTSSYGAFVEDIAPRLSSYEHSITDTCGFESVTVRLLCLLDEAQAWCDRLLFGCKVYGADTDRVWEGFLNGVSYVTGGETVSYSLDGMGNRVIVRYPLRRLGTPQATDAASDATSIALYGTHDLVATTGPTDSAAAAALRAALLAERALPGPIQDSTIAMVSGGGSGGGLIEVTLSFKGWYATLDWVLVTRADTTTEQTTTQVGTLIGTSSPGIGATNPFLSTSTARITASGVSETREIAQDTSYRAAIERRLSKGNSSGQRLAWGVYEDKTFVVEAWAGATPSTITYRTRLGTTLVETVAGLIVPPWAVRPNAMVETADFLVVGPPSGAIATPGRRPVSRVVCGIDSGGIRLQLEPAQLKSTDALLAQLGG